MLILKLLTPCSPDSQVNGHAQEIAGRKQFDAREVLTRLGKNSPNWGLESGGLKSHGTSFEVGEPSLTRKGIEDPIMQVFAKGQLSHSE